MCRDQAVKEGIIEIIGDEIKVLKPNQVSYIALGFSLLSEAATLGNPRVASTIIKKYNDQETLTARLQLTKNQSLRTKIAALVARGGSGIDLDDKFNPKQNRNIKELSLTDAEYQAIIDALSKHIADSNVSFEDRTRLVKDLLSGRSAAAKAKRKAILKDFNDFAWGRIEKKTGKISGRVMAFSKVPFFFDENGMVKGIKVVNETEAPNKKPFQAKTGPRSVRFHVMRRPVKQKRANTRARGPRRAPFAQTAIYSHSEGPSAATVAPLGVIKNSGYCAATSAVSSTTSGSTSRVPNRASNAPSSCSNFSRSSASIASFSRSRWYLAWSKVTPLSKLKYIF